MVLLLSLAIGAACCIYNTETNLTQDVFRPKSGTVGDIERSINDMKYGPVNLDAAKEVKNGLFARIRDNRQSRICAPAQRQACSSVSQTVGVPVQSAKVIVIQATGVTAPPASEYPSINPPDSVNGDCPKCRPHVDAEKLLRKKESPRSESKTGSFICSNCKKPHVGEEWHTDWSEDGTPITFLSESCY